MIKNFDELIERVKGNKQRKKVVLAAAHDAHSLEAIDLAAQRGIADPILIGDVEKIKSLITELSLTIGGCEMIEEKEDSAAAKKAVELIRSGKAEFIMKGKLQTGDLLREVVNKEHGLQTGNVMSHFGFFEIPGHHKLIVLTDGGMMIAPDAEQKRQIVENAIISLKKFGYDTPKVAVLTATEVVNPKMQASLDADQLKKWNQEGVLKDCIVEGPISFDLMWSKEAAEIKGFDSPVTGDADVWLVPDMTAGNLLAKSLTSCAGAKMAGMIVGATAPIVLVSRGASAEEKYLSLVLAAAASGLE